MKARQGESDPFMRKALMLIGALPLLLGTAVPVVAQSLDCSKEANRAACDTQVLARQRAVYDAPPLETLVGKGQVIRLFHSNAFGRNLGMIAVERRPGAEPRIETRFDPAAEPRPFTDQLSAPLPVAVWERLWDEGRFFDRTLGPPPASDRLVICADGSSVIVEMIDAEGRIRRATGSGCQRDLPFVLAEKIATAALDADPACALLANRDPHDAIHALGNCRMLGGDRAAAAQAFNVIQGSAFRYPNGPEDAPAIRAQLDDQVELNWPGEAPVRGMTNAARAWASHGNDGTLHLSRLFGETSDRVRIEGVIAFRRGEHEREPRTAKVTMIWERRNGFDFRLRSLVSEAAPPPPPDDH